MELKRRMLRLINRIITAWTLLQSITLFNIISYNKYIGLTYDLYLVIFCILSVAYCIIGTYFLKKDKKYEVEVLVQYAVALSFIILILIGIGYPLLAIIIPTVVVIYNIGCNRWIKKTTFVKVKDDNYRLKRSDGIILCILFVIITVPYLIWTVGRMISFWTPTLDTGIFASIIDTASKTGKLSSFIEFSKFESHLKRHMSLAFYLIVPIYKMVPGPITLNALSVIVPLLGVFPLFIILRNHFQNRIMCLLLCLTFYISPLFAGGLGYDLHENTFLTLFVMLYLYCVENKKTLLCLMSCILVLSVKEDAAIYTLCISFWYCLSGFIEDDNKKIKISVINILISLLWFVLSTYYISHYGAGLLTYRYESLVGEGGLLDLIKVFLVKPLAVIKECIKQEKMDYIFTTFAPTLLIPFITRKYERFILLVPTVFVNLMSSTASQYSIHYQYNFGTSVLLYYLMILNLSDIILVLREFILTRNNGNKIDIEKVVSTIGLVICTISVLINVNLFYRQIYPIIRDVCVDSFNNRDEHREIWNRISGLPPKSSVTGSRYYTTSLYSHGELYNIEKAPDDLVFNSDYIVIDPSEWGSFIRFASDSTRKQFGYNDFIETAKECGYEIIDSYNGKLEILKKNR